MSDWIDVTVTLRAGLPQWPGDPLFETVRVCAMASGDEANVTALSLCAHTGTHVDAPLHYIEGGGGVDELDLDRLIGRVSVVSLAGPWSPTERMLFRTRASAGQWWNQPFTGDFDALNEIQARQLVEAGVRTVGIDYLSIGDAAVHRILLAAEVCIIEGLNLCETPPGIYEMYCLPLKLAGADGAPARVILRAI